MYASFERTQRTQTLHAGVTAAFLELGIMGLEFQASVLETWEWISQQKLEGESLEIRMKKLSFP